MSVGCSFGSAVDVAKKQNELARLYMSKSDPAFSSLATKSNSARTV